MGPAPVAPDTAAARLPCPAFVITMRPAFWDALRQRLADWGDALQAWPATDGHGIDPAQWIAEGRYVPPDAGAGMTRGELGCSDSHRRVWAHVVEQDLSGALVLEDDADVPGDLPAWIELAWFQRAHWDLLYLGYNWQPPAQPVPGAPDFAVPDIADAWHVMHAYLVTQAGARRLLERTLPICLPVDVAVARATRHGLRVWQSARSLVGTVADTWSSTQGIR